MPYTCLDCMLQFAWKYENHFKEKNFSKEYASISHYGVSIRVISNRICYKMPKVYDFIELTPFYVIILLRLCQLDVQVSFPCITQIFTCMYLHIYIYDIYISDLYISDITYLIYTSTAAISAYLPLWILSLLS